MRVLRLPAEIEDRPTALARATGHTESVPLADPMKRHGLGD